MRRLIRTILFFAFVFVALMAGYGYTGYRDARAAAPELIAQADALIAAGRGGVALGVDRRAMLLAVEDPAFGSHYGIDFTTPGAGATTITQSLSKSEGFADFTPGLQKIRQSGYAIGLESMLTKPQILALFLDRVPMGAGPDGVWMQGLFTASEAYYGAPPDEIATEDFIRLIAVLIAPGALRLTDTEAPELVSRTARISALIDNRCVPASHGDVWLEGCDGA